MVMHKVRAASYLRRTISEPYPRRRPSAALGQHRGDGRFAREAALALVDGEAGGAAADRLQPMLNDRGALPGGDTAGLDGGPEFTWASDIEAVEMLVLSRWNVALICLPLGLLSSWRGWGDLPTFWLNFVSLIPLAALLGNVTEELALHTGDLFGGLLNATFGNAIEMILTIQALRAGLLNVVQGTLLGSILSNLLLVLGMSFFCGGIFHHIQKFNAQGATCSTSLLLLASLAFIVPTVCVDNTSPEDILTISRLTAVLIALTYGLFLFFQLGTHLTLFKDDAGFTSAGDGVPSSTSEGFDGDFADEWPTISATMAALLLAATTLAVSLSSQCLVGSIEGVTQNFGIPESFIGVILLPIVGNAAEHVTAVTVAVKNKPDLTMGVAVGSSTQIALFMVPFAVLAGWAMNVPLSLAFSKVSATILTFSVLIVIGVVQDGESNWLEGVMLVVAYLIVAIVFWFDQPVAAHMQPN